MNNPNMPPGGWCAACRVQLESGEGHLAVFVHNEADIRALYILCDECLERSRIDPGVLEHVEDRVLTMLPCEGTA